VQTVGQARVLREVARQGLLPYATFFASTRPFGTPLGPVALKYVLTVLVISALPARDAFNFVLDLASYPNLVRLDLYVRNISKENQLIFAFFFFQVFDAATAIGLWRLRARRAREGLPKSPFQVWDVAIVLWLLKCLFLLVMPWCVCHVS
jgi:amino acid transporter